MCEVITFRSRLFAIIIKRQRWNVVCSVALTEENRHRVHLFDSVQTMADGKWEINRLLSYGKFANLSESRKYRFQFAIYGCLIECLVAASFSSSPFLIDPAIRLKGKLAISRKEN